jgi:hypothetical protein
MVRLQALDYSIPWADAAFIDEFGPIENRKCYEVMHGRDKPCETCPTFKAFDSKEPVISEWHRDADHTYLTVSKSLPDGIPLVVESLVDLNTPLI